MVVIIVVLLMQQFLHRAGDFVSEVRLVLSGDVPGLFLVGSVGQAREEGGEAVYAVGAWATVGRWWCV